MASSIGGASIARAATLLDANPTLPRQDSFVAQIARSAALTGQRISYTWTYNSPSVQGVPMSTLVPLDDMPSLAWLVKVLAVSLEIVSNSAGALARLGATGVASLQARIDSARSRFNASNQQYASISATTAGKSTATAAALAQAAQLQTTLFSIPAKSRRSTTNSWQKHRR